MSEIIGIFLYIKSDQFYTILYFFHPLVSIMSLSMKDVQPMTQINQKLQIYLA